MAVKLSGNACVGQSGGPTAVINQSLVGVIEAARRHKKQIKSLLGAVHGTKGIMAEEFIDLFCIPQTRLEKIAVTPAAALGSVRHKPKDDECAAMLAVFKKRDVRFFFYIGGDDSARAAQTIACMAAKSHYDLCIIHVPKTIDNNLMESDHTPGFGSAARYVANAVRGDELDNRSLPGVKVNVIMGRDAGWLTAASMLARRKDGDGPHLIYLPEMPFLPEKFLEDVKGVYARHKRCLACVSEGIRDADEKLWAETAGKRLYDGLKDDSKNLLGKPRKDVFGHYQLSGTGVLADFLTGLISNNTDISRVRGDTYGYPQRSFPGFASKVDAREARQVGRHAVKCAAKALGGSVAIRRRPGRAYKSYLALVALELVAGKNRKVPKEHICPGASDICPSFRDYALPLVTDLPETDTLD
ncbi:MAG: diphosphate--fructose-6-phosphate 1-phosphotransferase [Planctomycetes bacterium]|nr:diphosphate--fructose-6-phosphate 1-phosphotransferase [Planctomycetota bacterium]